MVNEMPKIIDCTIRDGGLLNNWRFDLETVRAVYKTLSLAGVDYMEIGYKASKRIYSTNDFGKWRFCNEDDVKRVIDNLEYKTKLAFMVDIDRVEESDILPKTKSVFEVARVATYINEVERAIYLANQLVDKGYDTFINIMGISQSNDQELSNALEKIEIKTNVLGVYLVDSYGALYTNHIEKLVKKYREILKTKKVGIHAHNNQQMAFANTIEALKNGAYYLDATIYGIGRAAGNCPLELLIPFISSSTYDVRPILDVIHSTFIPLRRNIEWGYLIPYMLTGILNLHPKESQFIAENYISELGR